MYLVEALEARGTRCWVAPRNIPPGASWRASIVSALEDCPVLLVLHSRNANESDEMKKELAAASAHKRVIIGVKIDASEPSADFAYELLGRQWVDLARDPTNAVQQLASIIGPAPAPAAP